MAEAAGASLSALAAELEHRDERIAAEIAALAALDERTTTVRERAAEILASVDRLPAERAHLDEALAGAEAGLARARAALADAERERAWLESKRRPDEKQLVTARRIEVHARDDADAAERVLARVEARRAAIETEAERLQAEASSLEDATRALAADLRAQPRVSSSGGLNSESGLDGLLEWASRARAAILVARGGLETERERTVREAHELAAAVLDD